MGGLLSALLYGPLASLHGQLMPWVFFAPLPLLVIGFHHGAMAALAGLLAATPLLAATLSWPQAMLFLMLLGLPSWLICRVAWRPRLSVGQGLVMVAGYFMSLLALGLGSAWLQGENVHDRLVKQLGPEVQLWFGTRDPAFNAALLDSLGWSLLGFAFAAILALLFLNAAVAQGMAGRRQGWPRAPFFLHQLTLPRGWDAVLLALAALALLLQTPGFRLMAINMAIVAALPHLLLGLAVIHAWLKDYPQRRLFLLALYALFVVGGWLPFLVLLGLAEEWWRLRARMGVGV